jgi:hypothetical protein
LKACPKVQGDEEFVTDAVSARVVLSEPEETPEVPLGVALLGEPPEPPSVQAAKATLRIRPSAASHGGRGACPRRILAVAMRVITIAHSLI